MVLRLERKTQNWFHYILNCQGCRAQHAVMERRVDWMASKLKKQGFEFSDDPDPYTLVSCPKCPPEKRHK